VTAEGGAGARPPGRALPGGVEVQRRSSEAMRLNLWLRTASRGSCGSASRCATAFPELVRKASALPWERFVRKEPRCVQGSLAANRGSITRMRWRSACTRRWKARIRFPGPAGEGGRRRGPGGRAALSCPVRAGRVHGQAPTPAALCSISAAARPEAKAPLRETLAAALLLAAGHAGDEPFCDPLCGSGTVAIEAALIAMRRRPAPRGSSRPEVARVLARQWEHLISDARKRKGLSQRASKRPIRTRARWRPRENAARARVPIEVVQRRLADLAARPGQWAARVQSALRRAHRADVQRVLAGAGRCGEGATALASRNGRRRDAAAGARELGLAPVLRTQNGGIPVEVLVSPRADPAPAPSRRCGSSTARKWLRALVQRDQLLRRRVPRLLWRGAHPRSVATAPHPLAPVRIGPRRSISPSSSKHQRKCPFRRQSRPVAGGAERLGHAGDDPDAPAERAAVLLPDAIDARGLRQADLLQLELVLEPRADGLRLGTSGAARPSGSLRTAYIRYTASRWDPRGRRPAPGRPARRRSPRP